jgi:hypothetical protein
MSQQDLFLDSNGDSCAAKVIVGVRPRIWQLDPLGGSRYIIPGQNGLVIDSKRRSKDVTLWPRHGNDTQQWVFNADLMITSSCSGLALEVNQSNPRPGATVVVGRRNHRRHQTWQCLAEGVLPRREASRREFPPAGKKENAQIQVRDS